MGQQSPYRSGKLFGLYYSFPKRGDGIAMHAHPAVELQHNITVLRGSVLVYGERGPDHGWRRVLGQGDIFDFDSDQPHEIAALEDNTLILNMNLHGMPAAYQGKSEDEFHGVTDTPLKFPVGGDDDGDCVQGRGDGG